MSDGRQREARRLCGRGSRQLLAIGPALLLPQVASANAGTPLIWASVFHLTLGNLLIGLGEALLLARLTNAALGRAIIALILANYWSAFVGAFLVYPGVAAAQVTGHPIPWFLFTGGFTFIATVFLEYPFYKIPFRDTQTDPNDIWKPVIQINVISYVIILLAYGVVAYTPFVRFIWKLV